MAPPTRSSSILGPDGQPFQVALLSEEMAQPTLWGPRAVQTDAVASGLTPQRLAGIMRAANMGDARAFLTLAAEMEERYLHYRSQLQVRRLAFEAIDCSVSAPKGYSSKILEAVNALIDEPGFRDMATDIQDATSRGYSVVEPLWDYRDGLLKPVTYKWRDQRFFQFDLVALEELRLADLATLDGVAIPDGKFIRHMPRIATGIPLRRALARPAAWAFIVQSFTLQDWSAFAEIYGIPLRVGKYGPNATDDDKRTLLRALRAIASDAAAAIPASMELEFVSVAGQHGEAVFGHLIDYLDRQVSKIILGQTMTSDVSSHGGALAQAKVQNEVRLDILKADGRQTAATINRDLVRWFVALNFGPQAEYPRVSFPVAQPEDIEALSGAVAVLVPQGLKVAQREMRERLGLSEPAIDEDLLTAPAVPAPALAGVLPTLPKPKDDPPDPRGGASALSLHAHCTCPGCGAPATLGAKDPTLPGTADAIDVLMGQQLDDWQELTGSWLEHVFAIAAEEDSYEGVLRRLDDLRLDPSPLTERLARSTAIARGIGDTE